MATSLERGLLVVDSWPIMEWLKGREPASSRFDEVVERALTGEVQLAMSRLNFGEAVYSIRKARDIADPIWAEKTMRDLPLRLHTVDDRLLDEAVELKSRYAFAFGDAFAAALAMRLNVQLVTGDREFRALEADGLITLQWVGA